MDLDPSEISHWKNSIEKNNNNNKINKLKINCLLGFDGVVNRTHTHYSQYIDVEQALCMYVHYIHYYYDYCARPREKESEQLSQHIHHN